MENKATRYIGKVCVKHPELGGERHTANSVCVCCQKERGKARKSTPMGEARKKAYMATYRKTPQRKAYLAEYMTGYRVLHLDKSSARVAVSHAVAAGTLIPQPCELCNKEPAEAHHPSYSYEHRLDVVWLCKKHHTEHHAMASK